MFRNYLMTALRNLARNRIYGAINIVGLAVGFAAAMLIALYVRHEFSYDRWIPGYERVYSVSNTIKFPPSEPARVIDSTRQGFAAALTSSVSGIEAVTRTQMQSVRLRHGDVEAAEDLRWADPAFFAVLPLPFVAGNPKTALEAPGSLVLTRSVALKYFGRPDPVGESIEVELPRGRYAMRVTGVMEDLPSNTHLRIAMLGSSRTQFSNLAIDERENSTSENGHTYFRLRPGVSIAEVEGMQARLIRLNWSGLEALTAAQGLRLDDLVHFEFIPIAKVHLRPAGMGAMSPSGDPVVLQAMLAIGLLIITIASINFANLAAARAAQRAVEVGVRKAVGAARRDLVRQVLGETLLYVIVAMALAIAAVELVLPAFRAATEADVPFAYWRDPVLAAGIIATVLFVAAAAGGYPAYLVSALRSAAAAKGATGPSIGKPSSF
jgi:putative ABC transport system permease protein